VGCWHGYLSGARCRLAYGPADATATHCLAPVKPRLVLPFWYRLTQVVLEKRPLNGCKKIVVLSCILFMYFLWLSSRCKKWSVPVEKVYNKTQREKFAWAIDMADEHYSF